MIKYLNQIQTVIDFSKPGGELNERHTSDPRRTAENYQ